MDFDDTFRLSSHAVITNEQGEVLLLKADYGSFHWRLPGGALEPGETIHEALKRECEEELNCTVIIDYLSGVYYHKAYNSQAFIFRCHLVPNSEITLSREHSEYLFQAIDTMSEVQQQRVQACLDFDGTVLSDKF
jgi:8-oxo-dGTP diphosphatase